MDEAGGEVDGSMYLDAGDVRFVAGRGVLISFGLVLLVLSQAGE